jgi:hypothetical protein
MDPLRLRVIAFALCIAGSASAQQPSQTSLPPWCKSSPDIEARHKCTNVIPDAETAYAVGMAILKKRYSSSFVDSFMPYKAVERSGLWCLLRDKPLAAGELPVRGGGYPYICLSKDDGRVMEMTLAI